jgi:alpha/beta superfamily hydrolase
VNVNLQYELETLTVGDNHFLVHGPAGDQEVLVTLPPQVSAKIVVVICHPHPLFGGTMRNKVVHTVSKLFDSLGLPTVRFNFRGVGESEGYHGNGIAEVDDLLSIVQETEHYFAGYQRWLVGFSFGSFIAAQAANKVNAQQLITLAPPVQKFDYDLLPSPECPWLVVQPEADEVVPPESVFSWVERTRHTLDFESIPECSHFFHGKLLLLRDLLKERYQPLVV